MNALFAQIVEQTPCPVKIEIDDTIQHLSEGFFQSKDRFHSDAFIVIKTIDNDNNIESIVSLLHEKVHAEHEKNGCKCMSLSDNQLLAEYHAYKDGIKAALKLNNKEVLIATIKYIDYLRILPYQSTHRTAARRIVKLKLWQKALDFVK